MDSITGRSRGFGFVCFHPGVEGKKAMDAVLAQNHRIHRKWIDVKSAASYQEMSVKGIDAGRRLQVAGGLRLQRLRDAAQRRGRLGVRLGLRRRASADAGGPQLRRCDVAYSIASVAP